MKETEDGVHGLAVAVGELKYPAGTALPFGTAVDAGLVTVFDIPHVEPTGKVIGMAMALTIDLAA
jgi:hypothetical protein